MEGAKRLAANPLRFEAARHCSSGTRHSRSGNATSLLRRCCEPPSPPSAIPQSISAFARRRHHHHHRLRNTTILITGNSVGRGLHLELADLLGAQPRPSDRDAESLSARSRAALPAALKTRRSYLITRAAPSTLPPPTSRCILCGKSAFNQRSSMRSTPDYSRVRSSSRRLLSQRWSHQTNSCVRADGKVGGRNLTWSPPLVRPCINKLLAQWPNHRDMLQRGIESLPQPSTWIHRTHPAIRTVLPPVKYQGELSDQLATLQRDVVDLPIIRDEPPLHLFDTYLDTINVTRKHPEQYEDAIHPPSGAEAACADAIGYALPPESRACRCGNIDTFSTFAHAHEIKGDCSAPAHLTYSLPLRCSPADPKCRGGGSSSSSSSSSAVVAASHFVGSDDGDGAPLAPMRFARCRA